MTATTDKLDDVKPGDRLAILSGIGKLYRILPAEKVTAKQIVTRMATFRKNNGKSLNGEYLVKPATEEHFTELSRQLEAETARRAAYDAAKKAKETENLNWLAARAVQLRDPDLTAEQVTALLRDICDSWACR